MGSGQGVLRGPDYGLMDVTRVIHYKGTYQEAVALARVLEEEGVHVALSPEDQKQLATVQWQQERRELYQRHEQEQEELWDRLSQGGEELRARQPRQDQDQDQWRQE